MTPSNEESQQKKQKVGDYEILQEIGRGNYGTVYLAQHKNTLEKFAVKQIEKSKLQNKKVLELFYTEVSVMNTINHPNILHLYAFLESKNHFFLILKYCNRGDMEKILSQTSTGCFSEEQAVRYLKQILNGFQELRRRQILHRDFKLANIFMHDETVVIGDFGFAKQGIDVTSTFLGTPVTSAPELLSNSSYNAKADLWSVGVVFYEMLFGENPFWANSNAGILENIHKFSEKNLPFPKPISDEAKDLLISILQADPVKRIEWNDVFNHKLFDDKAPNLNGLLKVFVQFISEADSEFEKNRLISHDPTPQKFITESSALKNKFGTLQAKTLEDTVFLPLMPLNPSSDKVFIKEIVFRLNHEKNITSYCVSTFRSLRKLFEHNAYPSIKQNIGFLCFLTLKKALMITHSMVKNLISKAPICKLNPKYFSIFVLSDEYQVQLNDFETDEKNLSESYKRFTEVNLDFVELDKYQFLHNPYFSDLKPINSALLEELIACKNFYLKKLQEDKNSIAQLAESMQSVFYCYDSNVSFAYLDAVTKKKFHWQSFLERTKKSTQEEIEAEIFPKIK